MQYDVGVEGQDRRLVVGRDDPGVGSVDEGSGVNAYFVGRIDEKPNEIESRVVDDLGELNRSHRASSPLDDPDSHVCSDLLRREYIPGNGQRQVDGAEEPGRWVDDIGHGVDDTHLGGHHRAGTRGHRGDAGPAGVAQGCSQCAVNVGVTGDHHAVGQVADTGRPVRSNAVCQPGDVFDDDRLTTVDDADSFHADRATGSCLDGTHCDVQGFVGHGAVEVFAYFLDFDAEGVADKPELARPLTGDGSRK